MAVLRQGKSPLAETEWQKELHVKDFVLRAWYRARSFSHVIPLSSASGLDHGKGYLYLTINVRGFPHYLDSFHNFVKNNNVLSPGVKRSQGVTLTTYPI